MGREIDEGGREKGKEWKDGEEGGKKDEGDGKE